MAFPLLAAAGGAGGAGAAGGGMGGMGGMGSMMGGMGGGGGGGSPASSFGSMDMWGQLMGKIIQNNAERKQRALQSTLNADTMQYSPWTNLAQTAASSQNKNMEWVPGKALSQEIGKTLGFEKDRMDAAKKKEDEEARKKGSKTMSEESQGLWSGLSGLGGPAGGMA